MRSGESFRLLLEELNILYPDRITLTLPETANILGIDKRTLTRLIQERKVAAIDIGNKKNHRYLIPKSAVARLTATDFQKEA